MKEELFQKPQSVMRAISLWQPWAQWVMIGWKPIETRKHARFKGLVLQRIGIHAAAKWDTDWKRAAGPYLTPEQISITERFKKVGGRILGTVFVRDVSWLTPDAAPKALIECASIRRFGLILSEPQRFEPPITAKGLQGIFKFSLPV